MLGNADFVLLPAQETRQKAAQLEEVIPAPPTTEELQGADNWGRKGDVFKVFPLGGFPCHSSNGCSLTHLVTGLSDLFLKR